MELRVGPGEIYTKIQDAVNAAANHDTVIVNNGTYSGTGNVNIQIKGKSITVMSDNGPENCFIDCAHAADTCGFILIDASDNIYPCIIEGFTIQNGGKVITTDGPRNVGGVFCKQSHVEIVNNIITHIMAPEHIAGIAS
ncbi:MAG: hypothetical protein JXB48_08610 [Candidatus Latescibacteria bacterium]|nr:hypothetical protein [Candidatus Latescibacterota bacterium]